MAVAIVPRPAGDKPSEIIAYLIDQHEIEHGERPRQWTIAGDEVDALAAELFARNQALGSRASTLDQVRAMVRAGGVRIRGIPIVIEPCMLIRLTPTGARD